MGVVGALQIDVLGERLKVEYGLPIGFEPARFNVCRWISSETLDQVDMFITKHRGDIARDLDGDPVYMAANDFSLNYEADRAPEMVFKNIKDYRLTEYVFRKIKPPAEGSLWF